MILHDVLLDKSSFSTVLRCRQRSEILSAHWLHSWPRLWLPCATLRQIVGILAMSGCCHGTREAE